LDFMQNADIFYGHLEYLTDIWDILWPFGTFFPVLVSRTKKNLATLVQLKRRLTNDTIEMHTTSHSSKMFRYRWMLRTTSPIFFFTWNHFIDSRRNNV
jgi:hypothetical protein